MTVLLASLAGLAALTWALYLASFHPARLLTVALALSIGAQTEPGLSFGLLPRVVLALGVATALLVSKTAQLRGTTPEGTGQYAFTQFAALIVLFGVSLVSTDSLTITISAMAGAAGVFGVGIILGRVLGISSVLDQLFVACIGFIIASVLAAPFSFASEADRFRGVLENANMLGAVAALSAATSPQRWFRYMIPVSAAIIFFSGSRASALGFVVIVLFRFEWRSAGRLALVVMVPTLIAGLAAAVLVLDGIVPEEESVTIVEQRIDDSGDSAALLRTRDNRTAQWQQGLEDAEDALPLGIGFGAAAFEYASSPIFLIVETGLVALPITALVLLILFKASRGADRRARALFAGFALHSLFEGWMFAFGSALAVTFWLVTAASVAGSRPKARYDEIAQEVASNAPRS